MKWDLVSSRPSAAQRYGIAVGTVVLAVFLHHLFHDLLRGRVFFTFFPAVLGTALLAGFGPALLAALLSAASVAFLLSEPTQSLLVADPRAILQILLFVAFCTALAGLIARYRTELLRLRDERLKNLELLANATPVMFWLTDRSGAVVFVNDRWREFTGRGAEDQHPHDVDATYARYREALERREAFRSEFRLRRADGEYRWVLSYGVPRFSADGAFDGFAGSTVDIHEVKVLQEATRELTERLSAESARLDNIVSTVPGVVWEAWGQPDHAAQRIDYVSAYVTEMLGYTVEEWLRTPNFWLTIVHPDDQAAAAAKAHEHFARGGAATNTFRWIAKDGRAIWVESHSVVVRDDQGHPVGMRGVTLNVNERKRAEETVEFIAGVSEALASSLMYDEAITVASRAALPRLGELSIIDIVEEDGTLRRAGVTHTDPAMQPVAERLRQFPPGTSGAPAVPEVRRTARPMVVNGGVVENLSTFFPSPEHAAIVRDLGVQSFLVVPMTARGRIVGTIAFASRRTDTYGDAELRLGIEFAHRAALAVDNARLHRTALQASRARDEFLATLSHELRTPMTATLGWVRMLAAGMVDDENRNAALEAIERSTRAQARIIEDILDMSAIITGKFRLDVAPVDLSAVVAEAVAAITPAAAARRIQVDVSGNAPLVVNGDRSRLQQVVWNLVSNAIKFGRPGGRVDIRLEDRTPLARIVVSDDGVGIDAGFLPHVFERFRQADGTPTRIHGGLGLGLAIVKHLVEMHGGSVSAASDGAGQGATFTVELPLPIESTTARDIARPPGGVTLRPSLPSQ